MRALVSAAKAYILCRMPSGCSVCLGEVATNHLHPGDVPFLSSISPLARFRRLANHARTCSMIRDDTSSVPLPPMSTRGLIFGWACRGFVGSIGTVKASAQALDAIGMFFIERLQA